MKRKSLSFRLATASAAWIVATLLIAGVSLQTLFHEHIQRSFDSELAEHLTELISASEVTPDGDYKLIWAPHDPRFKRPFSGWYWEVLQGNTVIRQSRSADNSKTTVTPPGIVANSQIEEFLGPAQEPLRALVHDATLPRADEPFRFTIGGSADDIDRNVQAFTSIMVITLVLLGVGLLGAVLIQIRFGLRPLRTLQKALARVRSGKTDRLPEIFPSEIQPLVSELNALLEHNTNLLERARTQASNLTHTLKNPLTVIRNEATNVPGDRGRILRDQAGKMINVIERYRSHAQTAGTGNLLGARASVNAVVQELCFSMNLLHKDRQIDISCSGADRLYFQGDARDLEEMLGNLLDNACKWANQAVRIRSKGIDGRLRITVEDDGPGISENQLHDVLQRGRRLDESVPGSGLGLDIVLDIVDVYRGTIRLERSRLGGLKAVLELAAAT